MNEKIRELIDKAIDYEFEVNNILYSLSDDQIARIYNGCGPDWLGESFRKWLTKYYSFFEAAFMEHDVSFEISDGTRHGFNTANKRLYVNCKKLASRLSWFKNPIMKFRRYRQALTIYRACQRLGWGAWEDGNKKARAVKPAP
jgi:hypothetical protein